MADDVFGNPSLFQEFEKPRDPSDTILLKKLDGEFQEECDTIPVNGIDANESDENERGVSIVIGSSDTEDSHGSCDDIQEAECESETVSKNGTGRIKRVPKKTQHNSNTSICSETSSSSRIHKEQIEALKRENARLKQHSRIIDPSKFVHSEGGPVVQLIFLNNAFARKYRGQIEQFIAQLVAQERRHGLSTRAGPSSVCEVDGDPEATAKQTKASTVIGCSQIYHSFVVDNMGWPLVNSDPSVTDSWNMPRYEQSFPRALADDDDDDDNGGKKEKRRKAACFNCGGEHILSECQMKKDFAQIQKNRRDFQTQHQGPRGPKGSRYHVDDPRFSKFQPGVISDELRRALNLKKNQLPQYIYQMRVLGYPPGYLADAQVCTSGITMFDRHGKAISVDGEAPEEGEIDADKDTQKVEYDVSKIVEYPGFNVDPPEGTIDESRKLHAPPMKDHHRKEALEAQLLNMSSGTKRSTNDEGGRKQKKLKTRRSEDLQSVDMEIADSSGTEDELSRDRDGRLARLRSARLSSTTLEELEAEHAMLRRQLAAAEGTNEDVEVLIIDSSSDESFVPPLPPTPKRPPLPLGTPPVTPQQNSHMPPPWKRTPLKLPKPKNTDGNISTPPTAASTPCKGAVAPNTPQMTPSAAVPCTPESSLSVSMATPSSGGSISVESGTPVHEADQHLPDPSKFASCISEHIPFENLPNATGTFERVRRVLKKGKK